MATDQTNVKMQNQTHTLPHWGTYYTFHDPFRNPYTGNFSIFDAIFNVLTIIAWILMARHFWVSAKCLYLQYHEERIFLELLNTPQEERSNKVLDLCFQHIRCPQFQTNEMLAHVDNKLLLGEKHGKNLVVEALDEVEKIPRDKFGEPSFFYTLKEVMLMRSDFENWFGARYDDVKEILEKGREEGVGFGSGVNWTKA